MKTKNSQSITKLHDKMKMMTIFLLLMFFSVPALQNVERAVILDVSKKQLLIPLKSIKTDYVDNVSTLPQVEYSDSYYAEISDKLIMNELTKRFKSVELVTDTAIINKLYSLIDTFSISGSAASSDSLHSFIKEITETYKADFVVLPDSCILKYKTIHQKNWRDAKSGSSYERPVSITAYAQYHMKFYYKNGKLERESIGKGKSGQPLLYSIMKKKKFEKDVVRNSKKRYAPPLIKALNKAIVSSMKNL